MRSLIVVTILCLISTSAFACMYDTDCETGFTCLQGICSRVLHSGNDDDNPLKAANGKTCYYDSECSQGSRCIKGSGMAGVCIGHH